MSAPAVRASGAALSPAPGSPGSLRTANQRRVIELLQDRSDTAEITQAEIARATQLAPATVSNIVRELSGSGLLETTAGAGRRGTSVRFAQAAGFIAGIDLGHRHVRVAVGDLAGRILAETERPIGPDHHHAEGLGLASAMLDELTEQLSTSRDQLLTVGMGLPAPIGADGLVISSSILPGWVGINAAVTASQALGLPVHIDNDANLGALAEHRRGAGIGHSCMIYLKASSGLGGGIILGGEVFRGGSGMAGEIGHLTLDDNGPVCRCGSRGCLEAYTCVGTVMDLLAQQHPGATFSEIVAAAHHGDAAAIRVIEDAGRHLGWGVAMVANMINPTCVVIGGDMAQAGDVLLNPVRARLRRHALGSAGPDLVITTAKLGDRSSLVGALLLALGRTELVLPAAP